MPKGIPLTDEELQRRRREIFDACAPLFLEKGFHGTSMNEIASSARIGKSTLYDYFKSKDEIMISYFEEEIRNIKTRAENVIMQERNAAGKIRQIMKMHLEYLTANKKIYLQLMLESQQLNLKSQDRIQRMRYAYQDMLRALVEEGIRAGEFRPVNALFAARSVFTLLSIAVFTSRPSGTPEEMMEDAMDIFFNGVQA